MFFFAELQLTAVYTIFTKLLCTDGAKNSSSDCCNYFLLK